MKQPSVFDIVHFVIYHELCNHVTYFASRARAIIPEAIGVAALVPPKNAVQSPCKAVVLC